jgi:uncharacterized protein YndB with AHSA1/START domain
MIIFMVFAVLTIIIVLIPMFLSPKFTMSRSIEIRAPLREVFKRLPDLNEFAKWNPFPEGDTTNQTTVNGVGVNSTLAWRGDKTGEGKMTITKIVPDKEVAIRMEFFKPMSGVSMVYWVTNAKSDSSTEIVWRFEQDLTYFKRYFGLMMEGMMGKQFEKGLLNYKTMVEAGK